MTRHIHSSINVEGIQQDEERPDTVEGRVDPIIHG